jgi:hypothetical protein
MHVVVFKKLHGVTLDQRTSSSLFIRLFKVTPRLVPLGAKIACILVKELGCTALTHERHLLHGNVGERAVRFRRMVDDYAIACRNTWIAEK